MVTRVNIIRQLLLKDEALSLQPGSVGIVSRWGEYTWPFHMAFSQRDDLKTSLLAHHDSRFQEQVFWS